MTFIVKYRLHLQVIKNNAFDVFNYKSLPYSRPLQTFFIIQRLIQRPRVEGLATKLRSQPTICGSPALDQPMHNAIPADKQTCEALPQPSKHHSIIMNAPPLNTRNGMIQSHAHSTTTLLFVTNG